VISKDLNQIPEEVKAARSLAQFALEHGWEFAVIPIQQDSAGDPFFKILLKRYVTNGSGNVMRELFQITWHTRATGGKTYRLFSKIYQPLGRGVWVDAPSLKKIREVITSAPEDAGL